MTRPVVGPMWTDVHGIAARVVIWVPGNRPPILKVRARSQQYEVSLTPEAARDLLPHFRDLVAALEGVAET